MNDMGIVIVLLGISCSINFMLIAFTNGRISALRDRINRLEDRVFRMLEEKK